MHTGRNITYALHYIWIIIYTYIPDCFVGEDTRIYFQLRSVIIKIGRLSQILLVNILLLMSFICIAYLRSFFN